VRDETVNIVAVVQDETVRRYPEDPPFSPARYYPEYPFPKAKLADNESDPLRGAVYKMVRDLLMNLPLDDKHKGSAGWNPLGGLVKPGGTVLIKPNWVSDKNVRTGDVRGVITHGSVIRAMLDYALIAVGPKGRIIVGDAPIQQADFDAIVKLAGVDEVLKFYREQGVVVELIDFRLKKSITRLGFSEFLPLSGDPRGSTVVNLGRRSRLASIARDCKRFRVTCYDPSFMAKHHNDETNEYMVANSALSADLIINIPKLKTHKKVGLTGALKNAVGISADKEWLPHHRIGSVHESGDEYNLPSFWKKVRGSLLDRQNSSESFLVKQCCGIAARLAHFVAQRVHRDQHQEGSWYGNDTAWRMVLDLNAVTLFATDNGVMSETVQRSIFCVMDAIMAGSGEGPLEPDSIPVGMLIGGACQVAVDVVAARIAGFDYRKIPLIRNAFNEEPYQLCRTGVESIRVFSNTDRWLDISLTDGTDSLHIMPPRGWQGHIELSAGTFSKQSESVT